jgi:hypothetical protein
MPPLKKTGARGSADADEDVAQQPTGRAKKAKCSTGCEPGPTAAQAIQHSRITAAAEKKLECARCHAVSDSNKFPIILNADGNHEMVKTACERCWAPFTKSWSVKYSWSEMCEQCALSPEIDASFETTCRIEDQELVGQARDTSCESVTDFLYSVDHNYALIEEANFGAATNQPKMTVKLAEQTLDEVPDGSPSGLKGVLVKHPTLPHISVRVGYEVRKSLSKQVMKMDNHLRAEQATATHHHMHSDMLGELPTKVRGRVLAPSMSELKAKVDARARAMGLYTSPAASSADGAVGHAMLQAIQDRDDNESSNAETSVAALGGVVPALEDRTVYGRTSCLNIFLFD